MHSKDYIKIVNMVYNYFSTYVNLVFMNYNKNLNSC